MARHKNANWKLDDAATISNEHAILAVLMDIRDELKQSNALAIETNARLGRLCAVLECGNFLDVPRKLERIARNAAKIAGRMPAE